MDSRFSQSGFVTGSCLFVMEARKPPFFYSCFFCGGKFWLFVCRAMNPLFDAALYGFYTYPPHSRFYCQKERAGRCQPS